MNRFWLLVLLSSLCSCQSAQKPDALLSSVAPPIATAARSGNIDRSHIEARGKNFAIATQGIRSTDAAREILDAGGNIIDAAVAASFAVSVERPQSTGLGGGGFLLFHEASSGKDYAVDFRERAPARASAKIFLDRQGNVIDRKSKDGVLAAGVPGLVAGLIEIHRRFGKLPLDRIIQPAIQLAERGFPVYPQLARALKDRASTLAKDPAAAKIFLDRNHRALREGDLLIQRDLAATLKRIAAGGSEAFYRGDFARSLVRMMKFRKGLISSRDLTSYSVKWREPVRGEYHGYEVVSFPPPSSGGTHVIEFLGILANDPLLEMGFLSAPAIHLEASALQTVFRDRAQYLGDPDFMKVPVGGLLSQAYAVSQRKRIPADRARHADEVEPGDPFAHESDETTHLSIMDSQGNAIATTQTVNGWMGASVVVPGTGVVLNNQMYDFAAKIGASNLFGAIGGEPNEVGPGKTPLSSMSPTFLFRDGKVVLSLGAPGGTRIISCVAQTLLNHVAFGLPLYESIASVRIHHQWKPDVLELESPGPDPAVVQKLRDMGYQVKVGEIPCNVMAVAREGLVLHAVSDPRDIGTAFAE